MEIDYSRQILEKYTNTIFRKKKEGRPEEA
jgi:hypothetical protein